MSTNMLRIASVLRGLPRRLAVAAPRLRAFSSDPRKAPREVMEYDVVIVGAGPSGLSAAIRLKQLSLLRGKDVSVCVVEKGSSVGAHVLSGNVFEPRALDELIPEWRTMSPDEAPPLHTKAGSDKFYYLTKTSSFRLPTPPAMQNHGNYIISLSDMVTWLGARAEALGVEIYCGFSASEVLHDENNNVIGVATNDMGISKSGEVKDSFARGLELRAKQTILGEGCRGSLTKTLFAKHKLRANCQHQTFGLGVKELWSVDPSKHKEGSIVHSIGYPVDTATWGGSFMYHMKDNKVALGYVVGLDYENTYLSPYQELQRLKHHPLFASVLEGGKCISYGARTLNEGGLQSIPKLTFPGGVLVGCTAGFLNVPKVKGTHTAMKSGMLAAESIYDAVVNETTTSPVEVTAYESAIKSSWVYEELHGVRNIRPSFKWGLLPFLAYSALDTYILRGKAPWTIPHHAPDHACTKPMSECTKIDYPKPDGVLSFDLLTNLARSGTAHEADQPAHLKLREWKQTTDVNLPVYDGPEGRYCPAKVYEYVEGTDGKLGLVINAQNCLHCKTCDIKDPTQNIDWTVPECPLDSCFHALARCLTLESRVVVAQLIRACECVTVPSGVRL